MYEIIIKKKDTITTVKTGEYTTIDERPYTQEEVDEACREYTEMDKPEKDHFIKSVYGYAPKKETQEEIEREIFRIEVDGDIDIWHVIDAINRASE